MKIYEVMCKINNKPPSETFKSLLVYAAHVDKIYISDLLDTDKYQEIHKTVRWFLDNDNHHSSDAFDAWERFIEVEVVQ